MSDLTLMHQEGDRGREAAAAAHQYRLTEPSILLSDCSEAEAWL